MIIEVLGWCGGCTTGGVPRFVPWVFLLVGCVSETVPPDCSRCTEPGWEFAGDLELDRIALADLPQNPAYPQVELGRWTLTEVEHRGEGFPVETYEGGDEASRQCMVAAVHRLAALIGDSDGHRQLVLFGQMMSRAWDGTVRNVVVTTSETSGGALDYAVGTSTLLLVSQVSGSFCYLPTKRHFMNFLSRCPAGESRCDMSGPAAWAATRDVHDSRVDLREVPAPADYPAPSIFGFRLDDVQTTGAQPATSYEAATPASKRCLAAAAYRFWALFTDARARAALDAYQMAMPQWSGDFRNLNESIEDGVTASLEHVDGQLVWKSQTDGDQTCYLPTYTMVMEFFERCGGSAGCESATPDRWGATGNVSRATVDLSAVTPPADYPAPRVSGYPMEEIEFRIGADRMRGYARGSERARACAAAAAYRFEAILSHDEARSVLVTFQRASGWSGRFLNVTEDRPRVDERLEMVGETLHFVSQTADEGICHLPTLEGVIAFLSQ